MVNLKNHTIMSNEKIDASTVYTMFEEIKEKMSRQQSAAQSAPTPASVSVPALEPEDKAMIDTLSSQLNSVSEKLDRPLKHHHTLDFMSNKVLIVLVVVTAAFFVSLWKIDNQRKYRDNDLKYRYIQMHGEAAPADIERLRDVFDWNRNADSIRAIRRRVEHYERLVKETAEKSERARLNAAEAQRLEQEAASVKKGK